MENIPIWEKYAITPEEASKLFSISADFLRLAGQLTKEGGYDLPCFWIGSYLKINRIGLERWLLERADGHFDFTKCAVKPRALALGI